MTEVTTSSLPPEMAEYLRAYVHRRRWVRLWRALAMTVLFTLFWLLCWSIVDRLLHLPTWVRWVLLGGNGLGIVLLLARPIARLFSRNIDWLRAAEQAEKLDESFEQRLITVVSQWLSSPEYRASPLIVEQLTKDVSAAAAKQNGAKLVSMLPAVRAWTAAGASGVILVCLCFWPWLNLPQLFHRLLMPWAGIARVTTTMLSVEPGSTQIVEGTNLKVVVRAQRLGGDVVTVQLHNEHATFRAYTLLPNGDDTFEVEIPAIDRDSKYFVHGGDATSATYDVHVLRRPVITEFRIRYAYPAYTGLPPLNVSNAEGVIEAPVGSEATVGILTNIPLRRASMQIDGKTQELPATIDRNVRQIKLPITNDQKYSLELLSEQNISGQGPESTQIRAIPDRPPLAQVILPEDLRVHARDIVPLQYEALDDYGLESVSLMTRVNASNEKTILIPLRGDTRRQTGSYTLDLAELHLNVGDVVQINLLAVDRGGQKTLSLSRQLLIWPRSLDLNRQLRLSELLAAAQYTDSLLKDLDSARASAEAMINTPDKFSQPFLDSVSKLSRDTTAATESEALVKQSLLRAITRSDSPAFSIAMSAMVDDVQQGLTSTESVIGLRDASVRQLLNRANDGFHRLQDSLNLLISGERAEGVLAARMDLLASANHSAAREAGAKKRYQQAIDRARQDLAADALVIGLKAEAADFEVRLREMSEKARQWTRGQGRVDFVGASRQWAGAREIGLGARLATASQAEALGPDGQFDWARDLELCSRAAAKLETILSDIPNTRREYPGAFTAIHAENVLLHKPEKDRTPRQLADAAKAADAARALMRQWAGEDDMSYDEAMLDSIMDSNERMGNREYEQARQADKRRAASQPTTNPVDSEDATRQHKIEQAMNKAEKIDQLSAEQARLQQETAKAAPQQAAELARRQERVAQEIAQVKNEAQEQAEAPVPTQDEPDDAERREDAHATIASAQQQLAEMPENLRVAKNSAVTQRQTSARLKAAKSLAAATTQPALKQTAEMAAEMEEHNLELAGKNLNAAAEPLDPSVAETMAARLSKFAPQTAEATAAVDQQLLPALRSLQQALRQQDAAGTDRAAGDTRAAIESAQNALANAQQQLIDRDPIVSAKWFAQEADQALKSTPPDLQRAQQNQQQASAALNKAWDRSVHEAAQQRLAGVPAMLSMFSLYPFAGDSAGGGRLIVTGPGSGAPFSPRWAGFRPRDEIDVSSPLHEADPPGYEESLKAYFEALGKTK